PPETRPRVKSESIQRRSLMKRLSCFLFFAFVSACASAQSPLTLYDNFNSHLINSDKWFGGEYPSSVGEEAVRQILGGSLHLSYRGYGQGSFGDFILYFRNPANIRAIQATVKVRNYKLLGCAGN